VHCRQPRFSNTSPDIISGFDQGRIDLGTPSVGHIGFDQPSVDYDSLNIHNYSDHNVFASQPAQLTEFPYSGNDHIVHDPVISPASLNNYNDFNWSAIHNHDGLFSHDDGRLPVSEASYMEMPATQGYDHLLETSLSQTTGGPVDNACNTTPLLMPSRWGYGQLSHVGMGPNYELPMQEVPSNSMLAVNQTATGGPSINALGDLHPLMVYGRSEGPREAWNSDMNAVETNRTQPSDNSVPLVPIVSAGASLQPPQKQKAEKQLYVILFFYRSVVGANHYEL